MKTSCGSHHSRARLPVLLLSFIVALAVSTPSFAAGPAPDTQTSNYEIKFMKGMIDHHAMAIMMGEMCLSKAVHQELREMCQQIVAAQKQENDTMKSWLATWYGVSYEARMSDKDRKQMRELEKLSGADFEKAFMPMLVEHHRMAIESAAVCLERAYHPDLINMCGDIVTAQADEIKQLRRWTCEWYGMCTNPRAKGGNDSNDDGNEGRHR